jgi:hypothetical protein
MSSILSSSTIIVDNFMTKFVLPDLRKAKLDDSDGRSETITD